MRHDAHVRPERRRNQWTAEIAAAAVTAAMHGRSKLSRPIESRWLIASATDHEHGEMARFAGRIESVGSQLRP